MLIDKLRNSFKNSFKVIYEEKYNLVLSVRKKHKINYCFYKIFISPV